MFNDEIFEGKSFSDLLKEIHTNSKRKEKQINSLIAQLQPLVKNITDATILVPLIKRAMVRSESEGSDFNLSEDEKKQLLDTVKTTSKVEWEEESKVRDAKIK